MKKDSDDWSNDEIKASCEAYLRMEKSILEGKKVIKQKIYEALVEGPLKKRSIKSVDFRFRNISAVLRDRGEKWVSGHAPAKNVGARVAEMISSAIDEIRAECSPLISGSTIDSTALAMDNPECNEFRIAVKQILQQTNLPRPAGNPRPPRHEVRSGTYSRDPSVVAYVEQRASGKCEKCNRPAPFCRPDGTAFLEVHHIVSLAENGEDTVYNATAICPNCHRECHYSAHANKIQKKLLRLIRDLESD